MTVDKITNAPTQNELIDKTNEIIDKYIEDKATGLWSISIDGLATSHDESINIGLFSVCGSDESTAVGVLAQTTGAGSHNSASFGYHAQTYGGYSIALGSYATVGTSTSDRADNAIQIGYGTNTLAKTLSIGFYDDTTPTNWQLLDGATGLIPTARLSTFTGANGTNAGTAGIVPAPTATDNNKYLKGDGTWATVSSGTSTDVQINGTSITNQGVANILTNSAYDASSNKIATMSDLPTIDSALSSTSTNPVQNKEITGALNNKADDSAVVKKDGGSSAQTISLSSGTGTTALGVKSRSTTSSYISFTSSSTWLGSIGVNSSKKPVFYNGTGYTLATLDDIPDISGKQDTLVSGTNIKTINNTSLLGSGNIDIQGGTTDVQINGTSITSGGTANIITNSAYNASSNKIATMSDLPEDEIFVATYGTTTYADVLTAYNAGKIIFCKDSGNYLNLTGYSANQFRFDFALSGNIYTYTCNSTLGWGVSSYTPQKTSNLVTSISSLSTDTQYPSAKAVIELLKLIYPIGAIFIGTTSTCPMAQFFGTWELVAADRCLQGSSTNHSANTTIAAGLPNITGETSNSVGRASNKATTKEFNGSISRRTASGTSSGYNSSTSAYNVYVGVDASKSSTIYGNSTTVQPPAYVVNVWRRTE